MKIVIIGSLLLLISGAFLVSCQTVERPKHVVLEQDGELELRLYPDLQLVTAPMNGSEGRNNSFRKLFKYIDKGNEGQQKIAMTAPVIMAPPVEVEAAVENMQMSFVVPADVVENGVPAPSGNAVRLSIMKGGKVAVIGFKQSHDAEAKAEAVNHLKEWISQQGMEEVGKPMFAYYNPPWIPQAFRTNEVWIPVKSL